MCQPKALKPRRPIRDHHNRKWRSIDSPPINPPNRVREWEALAAGGGFGWDFDSHRHELGDSETGFVSATVAGSVDAFQGVYRQENTLENGACGEVAL